MILNLIEGIRQILEKEWNIPIYTDSSETSKPNFSISVPYSEEKSLMGNRCVRQIQLDIHYYPDEIGNLSDCYGIAERLFELTDIVSLPDGGNARGQNKKFEFTDGVIIFHASFDFILTVEKERDEENLMGTIDSQTRLGFDKN